MQEYSDSMHLPNGERDKVLRELAPVLGFDFWSLDEVQKEDAARELAQVYGDWRGAVCEIFGVNQRKESVHGKKKPVWVDKTDEEILDDLEAERDALRAWRDAYLGLREDLHAAVGLEDAGDPGEKGADDARETETVVEHVRETHRAIAIALGRDPEKVSLGDLPCLVADLERRHRAQVDTRAEGFMGQLREAVGVARDVTRDQILEAIGVLREHAGRDDADERVELLERRLKERDAEVERLEAQVERDAERVQYFQDLAQTSRPAAETSVRPPKALEDALHVQVGRFRAENERLKEENKELRRENKPAWTRKRAENAPEEREIVSETVREDLPAPKKTPPIAPEPEKAPAVLGPDTIRALGLPASADPATIRARIESLLRAERDLEADFLKKGALL